MKIITVSGAHSGVGKTQVVEMLLKKLKRWSALKITVSHQGRCPIGRECGACGKMDSDFLVIGRKDIIEEEGKDTQRFKKAGAERVLWLKAKPQGLKKGLKSAISRFKEEKGLIIEGNSALKYLKPDLAIFVRKKNNDGQEKTSASDIKKKVDLILTV